MLHGMIIRGMVVICQCDCWLIVIQKLLLVKMNVSSRRPCFCQNSGQFPKDKMSSIQRIWAFLHDKLICYGTSQANPLHDLDGSNWWWRNGATVSGNFPLGGSDDSISGWPPVGSCCETVGVDFCVNSVVFAGKAWLGNQCQPLGIPHLCTDLKDAPLPHCIEEICKNIGVLLWVNWLRWKMDKGCHMQLKDICRNNRNLEICPRTHFNEVYFLSLGLLMTSTKTPWFYQQSAIAESMGDWKVNGLTKK